MNAGQTATPTLHAVIDKVPGPDAWALVGIVFAILATIASAAVAIYTARLAKFTRAMAEQTAALARETVESISATRDSIAAEDRRLIKSLEPHIAIVKTESAHQGSLLPAVMLRNVGPGYAKSITATFTSTTDTWVLVAVVPTALESHGQALWLTTNPAGKFSDMLVVYEDAFSNEFESRVDGPYTLGEKYTFTARAQS